MPEGTWRPHRENITLAEGGTPEDCAICLAPIESAEGKSSTKFTEMGCCSATLCEHCFVRNFSRTQACPGCRTSLALTRRANGLDTWIPLSVIFVEPARERTMISNPANPDLMADEFVLFPIDSRLRSEVVDQVIPRLRTEQDVDEEEADDVDNNSGIRGHSVPVEPPVEDFAVRRRTAEIVRVPRGGGPYGANGPALNPNVGEGEGFVIGRPTMPPVHRRGDSHRATERPVLNRAETPLSTWERQLIRFWAQIPPRGFFSVASPPANSRGVDERTQESFRQFFERRFGHPLEVLQALMDIIPQAAIEPNVADGEDSDESMEELE